MDDIRVCTLCLLTKPIFDFVKDPRCKDGRRNQCKVCRKIARDAYFPPVKVAAYNLAYFATPQGKVARSRGNNKWRHSAKGKAYDQRPDVRAYRNVKMRTYRKRNPLKEAARMAIRLDKRRGRMVPASALACAHCGAQAAEYHHHNGYDPKHHLDVIPLCHPCHDKAG